MNPQSQLQMQYNVAIKKIEDTVCRLAGDTPEKNLYEVASILPMKTVEEVQEIEQRLEIENDFVLAMARNAKRIHIKKS